MKMVHKIIVMVSCKAVCCVLFNHPFFLSYFMLEAIPIILKKASCLKSTSDVWYECWLDLVNFILAHFLTRHVLVVAYQVDH